MLIREVAYATLPKAVRRERHAAVATQIEEFVGERIGASASILAHHWEQAGELDKAVEYMISAARVAGRAWAKAEAVALYSQALDLIPADDPRRHRLRLERATTLVQAGEFPQALPELDELIPGSKVVIGSRRSTAASRARSGAHRRRRLARHQRGGGPAGRGARRRGAAGRGSLQAVGSHGDGRSGRGSARPRT